ncbi:MAG: PEP-CTERM sorting domain-containing protein [Verrucomicrobiales bacterium]|nr:PEP-CTERM sorting domain-containing protein [Verrucomicrobiales bacterium]
MTNYSADHTEMRPLRMEGGGVLEEGGAVAAVGSFIGVSDEEISELAKSAEGIAELSSRFVMHGNGTETGTGGVLEETGIYGNDASAQILAGDELVGESIYTVVSTTGGLLVWRSEVDFPVDHPISMADVAMTDIPVDMLGSQLLVGGIGGVVEVDFFGGSMVTVELAAVDGLFEIPEERVVRFEKEPEIEELEITVAVEDEDEDEEEPGEPKPGVVDPPDVADGPEIVMVELIDLMDVGDGVLVPVNWFAQVDLRSLIISEVIEDGFERWEEGVFVVDGLNIVNFAAGDAGTVPFSLPEPDVAGLLGLGGMFLFMRRRR